MTNETSAIRYGELLIDEETGEVLNEEDLGLDFVALQIRDAAEQEKQWKNYGGQLKAVAARKLDELGVEKTLTPHGTLGWRGRTIRSAPVSDWNDLAERFGLDDIAIDVLQKCASELDVKRLARIRNMAARLGADGDENLVDAIDSLIQERYSRWIQLTPLRKDAPTPELVDIDRD